MRLTSYLHTGSGKPPWEYVELILCRDIYSCTPSELDEQDWQRVLGHMLALSIENKVQHHRMKSKRR